MLFVSFLLLLLVLDGVAIFDCCGWSCKSDDEENADDDMVETRDVMEQCCCTGTSTQKVNNQVVSSSHRSCGAMAKRDRSAMRQIKPKPKARKTKPNQFFGGLLCGK